MQLNTSHVSTGTNRSHDSLPKSKKQRRAWFFKRLLGGILAASAKKTSRHAKINLSKKRARQEGGDRKRSRPKKESGNKIVPHSPAQCAAGMVVPGKLAKEKTNRLARACVGREQLGSTGKTGNSPLTGQGRVKDLSLDLENEQQSGDKVVGQMRQGVEKTDDPQVSIQRRQGDTENSRVSEHSPSLENRTSHQDKGVQSSDARPSMLESKSKSEIPRDMDSKPAVSKPGTKGKTHMAKTDVPGTSSTKTPGDAKITNTSMGSPAQEKAVLEKNTGKSNNRKNLVNVSNYSSVREPVSGLHGSSSGSSTASLSENPAGGRLPSLVEQMAARVGQALAAGRSSVSIRLDPPDLGELNVVFSKKGGKLRVVVQCGQSSSYHVLQQEIDQLEKRLTQMGIDHAGVDLAQSDTAREDSSSFADTARDDAGIKDENFESSKAQDRVNRATVSTISRSGLDLMA